LKYGIERERRKRLGKRVKVDLLVVFIATVHLWARLHGCFCWD
jgi:hypothetical protein